MLGANVEARGSRIFIDFCGHQADLEGKIQICFSYGSVRMGVVICGENSWFGGKQTRLIGKVTIRHVFLTPLLITAEPSEKHTFPSSFRSQRSRLIHDHQHEVHSADCPLETSKV